MDPSRQGAVLESTVALPDPALLVDSYHVNPDLAPTTLAQRRWGVKDIAALWISMSACIPTYMIASSLIAEGMNWWQAVLTIFLGNVIVVVPMIMNAHAGTKYGIPFPIYCRASFGILGANVPALLRALVACGWFGIQTWIGGKAIYDILAIYVPAWKELTPIAGLGINAAQLVCFLAFWAVNMIVIWMGINSIRVLLNIKAPLLIVLGLALLVWAYYAANGFGPMLAQPSQFDPGQPKAGGFWEFFFPALTGMIGFWATLSLNIPDFSRYAKTQRDQMLGQVLGLPPTMALYSFIGVAVTSATVTIYGRAIWDPVEVLSQFRDPFVLSVGMVSLCLATLATNIAANVVGPANDFSHLWPRRISFRTGGLITGVLGILIQPWKLIADPTGYIFRWLVAYSSLLGAVGGILIADYYVLRRTRLDLKGLYHGDGPTGSLSRLPGLPVGARAAQLVDSNIELPGGFLDLFNKPVRESSCECERSGAVTGGAILAMVNGPIIAEAIRDPNNRLNRLVLSEKDDAKVVEGIYLSVLNRLPTAKESEVGIKAIRSAGADHAVMLAEHKPKADAFAAYQQTLAEKQKAWETGLRNQKPTAWTNLDVLRAESKHGAPATAKPGATLTINKDGSILASGKTDAIDIYTVTGLAEIDKPITAIRLEVLADASLPVRGPGGADNGNFVLNEFRLTSKTLDKPDAVGTPIKLTAIQQIFQQDGFPAANAVDGNLTTGWATSPRFGQDNAALFRFQQPVHGPAGVAFTAVLDQRFGTNHVIGKFRLSVTTDPNPKLTSPVTPEQVVLLDTPEDKRTPDQKSKLQGMYLAQDKEYQRLAAEAANAPPTDARVLGAQDLVWALINSPAFLFNH